MGVLTRLRPATPARVDAESSWPRRAARPTGASVGAPPSRRQRGATRCPAGVGEDHGRMSGIMGRGRGRALGGTASHLRQSCGHAHACAALRRSGATRTRDDGGGRAPAHAESALKLDRVLGVGNSSVDLQKSIKIEQEVRSGGRWELGQGTAATSRVGMRQRSLRQSPCGGRSCRGRDPVLPRPTQLNDMRRAGTPHTFHRLTRRATQARGDSRILAIHQCAPARNITDLSVGRKAHDAGFDWKRAMVSKPMRKATMHTVQAKLPKQGIVVGIARRLCSVHIRAMVSPMCVATACQRNRPELGI